MQERKKLICSSMARALGAQEASSSSNTTFRSSRHSYDVFLSFRGKDTRKTFTDHLYTALDNAGFRTFRDNDELQRGEDIKPEFRKAIQQSRSSVIVFSKDYASSRWCLNELVMILERKKTSDHVVLPVFYDLDPSHLRKQTGSLAKAFARHQKTQAFDTVKGWREALAQAADLAGMVLQNEEDGHESRFIMKIVKVIEDKLRRTPLIVGRNLIGIHFRVKDINLWLQDRSHDVGILVIYGMRGIGKTTIAKIVYGSNCQRFERHSFVENVREISEQSNGLIQIQKQLLHDLLNGRNMKVHNISQGIAKIEDAICSKRVLLVLDDVDSTDQLDGLLRMQDQFYPGSKVILTTNNAALLNSYHKVVKVHNVDTLNDNESLELLSLYAFGQDHPIQSYMNHCRRLVHQCGGLPLALKILGSSLSGKDIGVWESQLNKLEAIPNGQILKKLKISYDSLQDSHDQDLFLHIACFFIRMEKDVIVRILDDCGFFTDVGIQNLIDRCLLSIDEDKMVQMHKMIRDMGRGIVLLESKDPRERSRLWYHRDAFKVLTEKNGTQTIEGLVLNMPMHIAYTPSRNPNEIVLETDAFSRMQKLRLLQLSCVKLSGSYKEFPTGLRWLCWSKYPLESLPADLSLKSLGVLEMCYSSLRQIWERTDQYLSSLKILNLSHSRDLIEIPNFSLVPNLERLILKECASLVHVHESIGDLGRLVYLNMEDCKSIRKLPESICMLTSLETFIISGCSNLEVFPTKLRKIQSLKVFQADGVPIHRLLTATEEVILWPRKNVEISWTAYLPCNLVDLSLSNCNLSDDNFPRDFGSLSSLKRLDLSYNLILNLPDCFRGITRLQRVCFEGCTKLKSLERLPNLEVLDLRDCKSLEKVTFRELPEKMHLYSWGCNYNKLVEFEGFHKLEPIERVDVEMTKLLGLSRLNSTETIMLDNVNPFFDGSRAVHPIQGLYENGIFSTFLPGNEVPQYGSYSHRSRGFSISFTVPILPNRRIRGLNFFCIYAISNNNDSPRIKVINSDTVPFHLIMVGVSNKSKGLEWTYAPSFWAVPDDGQDVIWLSHWKFGNKMEGSDEITFSVFTISGYQVKECGILVVHEQEEKTMSTQDSITDPYGLVPGIYIRCGVWWPPASNISDMLTSVGFNSNIGDYGDITDHEEEEESDCTLAAHESSNSNSNRNSSGGRGWKVVIIMATVFFLSLPLVS